MSEAPGSRVRPAAAPGMWRGSASVSHPIACGSARSVKMAPSVRHIPGRSEAESRGPGATGNAVARGHWVPDQRFALSGNVERSITATPGSRVRPSAASGMWRGSAPVSRPNACGYARTVKTAPRLRHIPGRSEAESRGPGAPGNAVARGHWVPDQRFALSGNVERSITATPGSRVRPSATPGMWRGGHSPNRFTICNHLFKS